MHLGLSLVFLALLATYVSGPRCKIVFVGQGELVDEVLHTAVVVIEQKRILWSINA